MSRRVTLRVVQAVISVGLLGYLVTTVPMRDVAAALADARYGWMLCGLAAVLAAQLTGALQMRSILALQGVHFSVWQVFGINVISIFYGLVLPSSLAGGAVRWYHFSSPEGKHAQALAAMIFSRGVEIVTMLGFGVVFWFAAKTEGSSAPIFATLAVALAAMVSIVLLLVSDAQHALVSAAMARFARARRLRNGIRSVSACLAEFGHHGWGHQLRFLAVCIIRNAFAVAAFLSFARAIGVGTPAADLGWVRSATDLLLILPISVAGVGVRDASLVALLAPLGVAPSLALAFAFVLLGVTVLISIAGGLVEALRIFLGVAPGLRGRTGESAGAAGR